MASKGVPSSSAPSSASLSDATAVSEIDRQIHPAKEEKNVPATTNAAATTTTTAAPTVTKTIAPAPNGKTPIPSPIRPRVEPSASSEPSSSMAPPAESGTQPIPVQAAAATTPPAGTLESAVEKGTKANETPAVAVDASTTTEEAILFPPVGSETPATAPTDSGEQGAKEGVLDGGSMSDLKDALPPPAAGAVAEAGPLAAEAAAGKAEGDEHSAEEEASTNSLKDDPGTPEECNLFVGDLARNLTDEKLEKAFEPHGKVMSVSIKRDRATGKNLGYGFVKLSSHQEARAAKEAMQGVELGGRRVRVGWAQKNTSLYVGGLEGGAVTTEMLVREFARFGPLDKELTSIKAGGTYGFVKYRYRVHAEAAKKELNERPAFGGLCPSVQIEWNSVESSAQGSEAAESEKSTQSRTPAAFAASGGGSREGVGPRGRKASTHAGEGAVGVHSRQRGEAYNSTVHVQFEGEQARVSAVNESMIRKCFTKFEPVVDVVIPATRTNGSSSGVRPLPRCWAFVHFPPTPAGERAAAAAIKSLNGTTISELKVHCTLSRNNGGPTWRKPSNTRSRRHSIDGSGSRGGQGFTGRPSRSSLDGPGTPQGRGGGWGVNTVINRHNMQVQPNRHLLVPGAGGPHPPFLHMQHPPHLLQQPHHPQHPQHVVQLQQQQHQQLQQQQQQPQPHQSHQQMYAPAGYPGPAVGPAFMVGQYPGATALPPGGPEGGPAATAAAGAGAGASGAIAGTAGVSGGAAAGAAAGGSEMTVQAPYGVNPYQYAMSFQGVTYAPAQQGYQMGYPQMYQGYQYPAMPQGQQLPGGVQAGVQQQQQLAAVPQNNPQQPGSQSVPQAGAAAAQQQARATPRQPPRQQQHMGMQQQHQQQQHPMVMGGQGQPNPASAAATGLSVGVPSYMPAQHMYQLPQQQMPGGGEQQQPGAADSAAGGGGAGGVEGNNKLAGVQ